MPKAASKTPKPAKTKKAVARAAPAGARKTAPVGARKTAPVGAITMRELQKISAATIEALPHPVPIKSGGRTVAILSPLPKPMPAEAMAQAMEAIREAAASRSKEADERLAAYLGEPVDDAEE